MIERLTTVMELPVDAIQIEGRLRDVDPDGVANLVEIISERGFFGSVLVRRTKKGDFVIDGAHRLTAMRELGEGMVPCNVVRCSDDEARMLEIDGNIAGAGMTDLQVAYFLARRRETFQRMNPKARQGYAGASGKAGVHLTSMSLAKSIASERGVTERHIYRMMAAGDAIGPDEYRRLSRAPKAIQQKDLLQIAKINETGERYYVINALAEGSAKSASAARKLYQAEVGEVPAPKSDRSKAFDRLSDAWTRAGRLVQRSWLEANAVEVRALLDEMDGGRE